MKKYYWIIGIMIFVFSEEKAFSQQNLFRKSRIDIREYFKEANFPLIDSGVSKAMKFDTFNCDNQLQTICYYGLDGCWLVKQILPLSFLPAMIKELNYSDVKIKAKPNVWTNLKGDMRIELSEFKKQKKFTLSYIEINN